MKNVNTSAEAIQYDHETTERNNPLVGTWKLSSYEIKSENGDVAYPFGQNAIGFVMYSINGYMSANIMKGDRPECGSEHFLFANQEEKVMAADGYLSYGGKYKVNGKKVQHHTEFSLFPNWVGTCQERFYKIDGNKLVLSTSPIESCGINWTAHLEWVRV